MGDVNSIFQTSNNGTSDLTHSKFSNEFEEKTKKNARS